MGGGLLLVLGPPIAPARGAFWIDLIVTAVVVAIVRLAEPTQPRPLAQTAPHLAAPAVDDAKLAQLKTATLGLAQIHHTVANSNILQLSRVTAMPTGTICYQLHLKNSHGVAYARTAMIDGTVLSTSRSDGFSALWNRRCAQSSSGHDITAEVKADLPLSSN